MQIPTPEYQRIQAVLPILCVDAVIIHEGCGLLLLRRNHPARGQLWFPGGRLHKNETIADAARRKALEEVSLDCEFQSILSIEETPFLRVDDMLTDVHTVNICCHLTVTNMSKVVIDSHHEDYRWVGQEEAQTLPLHEAVRRPLSLVFGMNQ
jgi:colanic acid biosynthesis protein WcaH